MNYFLACIAILICCSMESYCKDTQDSIWVKKRFFSNSYYMNGVKISFAQRDSLLRIYPESADQLSTAKYYKYGATTCYILGGISGVMGFLLTTIDEDAQISSSSPPGQDCKDCDMVDNDYINLYFYGASAVLFIAGSIFTAQKNIYILKSIDIFNTAERGTLNSGAGLNLYFTPTRFGLFYNFN